MREKLFLTATLYLVLLFIYSCADSGILEEEETIIKPKLLKESVEVYEINEFQDGYTLIAPLTSKNTYLIDMEGYVVKKWVSDYTPNNSVYLLEDGTLLRTEKINSNTVFSGKGGSGGRLAKYNFDGTLIWAWKYSSENFSQHHDIELMPNGNILVIAWEIKTNQETIDLGKNPEHVNENGVWPEHIVEIETSGASGGNIVWEWHQWDHMIQDFDPKKRDYGDVAAHPELIDMNFSQSKDMDITHLNGIDYIEEYDLIILSAHHYSEIWIIDHATSTEEAASHQDGARGKGGDLVYRWGNPAAHKNGLPSDQISFMQHDAVWLDGLPSNGGNLLFFNNGDDKKERAFSTVDEIFLPIDANGDFELLPNSLNNPTSFEWRFEQEDFYSRVISGAQRLKNGNTLICEGRKGLIHEVTKDKKTVWKYNLPIQNKNIFRAYRYPKDYAAFTGKSMERLDVEIE